MSTTNINIQPLGDRVLVLPKTVEQMTKSGIYIPESSTKEKPEQGTVIAVGPGARNDKGEVMPMSVKVGDEVLFTKYSPDEITIDNTTYLILKESSLLGIVTK